MLACSLLLLLVVLVGMILIRRDDCVKEEARQRRIRRSRFGRFADSVCRPREPSSHAVAHKDARVSRSAVAQAMAQALAQALALNAPRGSRERGSQRAQSRLA
ncbi:unnamed protein product [Lampetra fluviatilis]